MEEHSHLSSLLRRRHGLNRDIWANPISRFPMVLSGDGIGCTITGALHNCVWITHSLETRFEIDFACRHPNWLFRYSNIVDISPRWLRIPDDRVEPDCLASHVCS